MKSDSDVKVISGSGGHLAALYTGKLQIVALYFGAIDDTCMPAEVRTWRASRPLSSKEMEDLLRHWLRHVPENLEVGVSSIEVRGIPLGRINRAIQSHGSIQGTLPFLFELDCLSDPEVENVIEAGNIPEIWRSSRDFRSHARELRSVYAYLLAVYSKESAEPMRSVAVQEGISIEQARKVIDQARSHGYLTRTAGVVGGRITEKGIGAARMMREAMKLGEKE